MVDSIAIIEGTVDELRGIYPWYAADFPEDERKSYAQLERLVLAKKYRLLLARHESLGVAGYALVYDLPGLNAVWLDYLAIDGKIRNAGYGSLLFQGIAEPKTGCAAGVFLEVEVPQCQDQQNDQMRRIRFYERLGAKRLNVEYRFPTPGGGFPMLLYYRPAPGQQVLPKESIRQAILSVYDDIHADIPNRDEILKTFIDGIQDEYFDSTTIQP